MGSGSVFWKFHILSKRKTPKIQTPKTAHQPIDSFVFPISAPNGNNHWVSDLSTSSGFSPFSPKTREMHADNQPFGLKKIGQNCK
jgi:hypothetical protein